MLKRLCIDNFKCFNRQEFELKSFNLLAGPNSSGKSSTIQALLLLFEQIRHEEILHLGTFSDLRNMGSARKKIIIEAEMAASSYQLELCQTEGGTEQKVRSEGCTGDEPVEKIGLVYMNAERSGVRDVYPKNTKNEKEVGIGGEFSFAYLSRSKNEPLTVAEFLTDEAGAGLNNQVDYWLDYILGYRVSAENIPDTDLVKVTFGRKNIVKQLRPINVGTGVTYVANLIISALSCKKDSLFIVENPEIHLHPDAQARILDFFVFLAARGLQIIVESHSDHIYNGLRRCIKNRNISSDAAMVYYYEMGDDNNSMVTAIPIRSDGAEEKHPRGLFDRIDEDMDELLGL